MRGGKLQEVTVGTVKAVIFQPVLDCSPLTFELQGAPDTAITDICFQTSPSHLHVVNAIGGGALAPALIVSDLPEVVPAELRPTVASSRKIPTAQLSSFRQGTFRVLFVAGIGDKRRGRCGKRERICYWAR